MTSLMLSAVVLASFLVAALVFLLLARIGSRIPSGEVWFAALAQAVLSTMLLRGGYEAGIMLSRTPVLVYAGFTALAVAWGFLRRETALLGPPVPEATAIRTTALLAAVPASGVASSLVALVGEWEFAPEVVGVVQMLAFAAAWLVASASTARTTAAEAPPAAPAPRLKVFLSYRRDDSADVTGRIYDRLVERFGVEQVFKDVDSIPLGVDFRDCLAERVGACDAALAIIGRHWLARGAEGHRRLDEETDFVRLELEATLARGIPVVPVLVGGAEMPRAEDLPPSLAALAYRQCQVVRPDPDFHRDVDRLLVGLERLAPGSKAAS